MTELEFSVQMRNEADICDAHKACIRELVNEITMIRTDLLENCSFVFRTSMEPTIFDNYVYTVKMRCCPINTINHSPEALRPKQIIIPKYPWYKRIKYLFTGRF